MYTEYVFDDKKYEVASKNLKSILFDIVNAEGSKLADIRQKIAEADDSGLREQLIDLCNRQEVVLLRVLNISNHLTKALQSLDSFSKDVKTIENQSIAEIVSHYVEQQKGTDTEVVQQNNNVPVEEKTTEDVRENEIAVPQIVSSIPEKVVSDAKPEKDEKHDEGVHEIVKDEKKEVEGIPEEPVLQSEKGNEQVFSNDLMEKEENKEEKEEIVNIFQKDRDSNTEEVKDADNKEDTHIGSDEVVDEPVIESSIEESSIESDASEVEQTNSEKENENVDEISTIGNTTGEVNSQAESTISIEVPKIDNINEGNVQDISVEEEKKDTVDNSVSIDNPSTEEVVSNMPEISKEASSVSEISDNEQNIVLPSIVDSTNNNDNTNSESPEGKSSIVFEKVDTANPKVILTTESQVSKLRASKNNNESLLTAKQFFKVGVEKNDGSDIVDSPAESNLVFPEELIKEENVPQNNDVNGGIFAQEIVSPSQNVPQELSKEQQMEMMMQQITELYKDGKVDEAQALSDKVSELNRELQQSQKVLAA